MLKKRLRKVSNSAMDLVNLSKYTSVQKILFGGGAMLILGFISGYWIALVLFSVSVVLGNYLIAYILKRNIPMKSDYLLSIAHSISNIVDLLNSNSTLLTFPRINNTQNRSISKVDEELKKLIDLINRDFIKSWFEVFSNEETFLNESQGLFIEASHNLKLRISRLSLLKCAKLFIDLYRKHLASYQVSKLTYMSLKEPKKRRGSQSTSETILRTSSIEEAFNLKFGFHFALKNSESESEFIQNVIKTIICNLLPENFIFCQGAQILVNEILFTKVILVLISKLSTPDFLYLCLIKLTSEHTELTNKNNSKNEQKGENSNVDHKGDNLREAEMDQDVFQDIHDEETENTNINQSDTSKLNSADVKTGCGTSDDFQIPLTMIKSGTPLIRVQDVDSEEGGGNSLDTKSLSNEISECNDHELKNIDKDFNSSTEIYHDVNDSDEMSSEHDDNDVNKRLENLIRKSQEIEDKGTFYLDEDSKSDNSSLEGLIIESPGVEFNPLIEMSDGIEVIDSSLIFQGVSIADTETVAEYRSQNHYTLYIVQFEAMYFSDSGPVVKTGKVKRRFREFVNLNSRLESSTYYKNLLKDVKGPKRWQNLPFKNMDKENVEYRRIFLEQFLKSLIEIEAICNGPELREFLAYEGDSHIAFVKKPAEITVPRIDKMLARTVSGMFDKIKSLPGLSQDMISGIVRRENSVDKKLNENTQELDKIDVDVDTQDSPYPNQLDKFIYQRGCGTTVTRHQTPEGEKKTAELRLDMLSKLPRLPCDGSESPDSPLEKELSIETKSERNSPLCESVLNLMVQLGEGHDLWICRQRVLTVIKISLGRAIDRFLQDQLGRVTTEDQWEYYLSLIREIIWPNGKLADEFPPIKTELEKEVTKQKAKDCLLEFFPGWFKQIVGLDEMEHGVDQIIQSLQHEKLNKQFLFLLIETLMEEIFPEIDSAQLQSSILSS
ncbi:hypothetical protein LOTGIDRAFT_232606 [Lottia gigantea]|uniref:PX domain-containing protein n=1 Tax=Lottia gigantea TaxID=225164 RepID=V4AJ30_LOTGI|nr:hypothetical protein LOTGIDRAFT_232606 [Lottia gigantea]ESO93531.1 hypothetical protein LOTGIDRAFT_232606 [Lottia gigantea]